MTALFDKYGRLSLDVASATTSVGFAAAKAGTKLGFGITRGIAASAAGLTGSALEVAFGGYLGTGESLGNAVSSAISAVEQLALLPIVLGENLTSASIVAAYSSINALGAIFPGSDETSFSLASFITLVRREWNEPLLCEHLPEEHYSVSEVARALVAWGALQGVTYDWQAKKWAKHLREIPFHDESSFHPRQRTESRISITGDVMLSGKKGQLITADITELDSDTETGTPPPTLRRTSRLAVPGQPPVRRVAPSAPARKPLRVPNSELKHTLRRLSKLVLAGYGGASLLFFGVSPTPTSAPAKADSMRTETATLEHAVDASEMQALTAGTPAASPQIPSASSPAYSWWNVLLGRHDHEIFMGYAKSHAGAPDARPLTAVVGDEDRMPRFWVLTDHARRQIVLVFRGTMSLNELAVDLTCDPEEFEPASSEDDVAAPDEVLMAAVRGEGSEEDGERQDRMPGSLPFPSMPSRPPSLRWSARRMRTASFMSVASFAPVSTYQVHGGMLKMANAMGGKGKPVHVAVKEALRKNKGFELVMCGHSLGSGVASLLGLMWADPKTCLTVRSSGLPVGRRVSVYCFGPPCLTDVRLSTLSANLITSFVYSQDVVSRLSLGSIRDITRAAAWLCKANTEGSEEGFSAVTRRALKWKTGFGSPDDPVWFLAIRKTLEANMPMANLYPPGRVMWAMRDGDMESIAPVHGDQKYSAAHAPAASENPDRLRLFEVLDVERVFSQIVFARDMLSAHLPHQYDKVLEELL